MKVKVFAPAVAIICGITLSSCAQQSAKVNSFTDPTFAGGQIKTLAIFPITNSSVAPSEAMRINQTVGPYIAGKNPSVHFISPTEAIDKINEAGLAQKWADFKSAYASSGIPDATTLRAIGAAIGTDGILQGAILKAISQDGMFGVRKGGVEVAIQFTIFDVRSGKVVWQASSDGTSVTATTLEAAPPLSEAIESATHKLAESMPPL